MRAVSIVLIFVLFFISGCGSDSIALSKKSVLKDVNESREVDVSKRVEIEMHGKENSFQIKSMEMNLTKGLGSFLENK